MARDYMKDDALTADPDEPAVVRLSWDVVGEIGRFCGLQKPSLRRYIRDFTPNRHSKPDGVPIRSET
jgi:hypothetical protein